MGYQTPKGMYDILPNEAAAWHEVEEKLHEISARYGYHEIRTPYLENTEVFKRENDSSDMVNKEMYTLETAHHSFTLRPEGTAGVIRSFVEHKMYGNNDYPVKLYYMGPMFRSERPQKGRQRQFNQYGVENIGITSPEIDAEMIAFGVDILKSFNISSLKVLINTLGDEESRKSYRTALQEYFTPHVDELCDDCKRRLEMNPLRILDCKVDRDSDLVSNAPKMKDYLTDESSCAHRRHGGRSLSRIPYYKGGSGRS